MIRLWIGYILIVIPFATMVGAARALGGTSHARSPVNLTSTCELPCWRGIEPGRMLIDQANHLLRDQGYKIVYVMTDRSHTHYFLSTHQCAVRLEHNPDDLVTEVRLVFCPGLQTGDIITTLGKPHTLGPNFLIYQFGDGVVRVRLRPRNCDDSLSPHTGVAYISLRAAESPTAGRIQWQGFAPNWRYFQAAPHIPPLAC